MNIIHVTLVRHLSAILREGLRPDLATGKRKAVWAVTPGKKLWAILHVCLRHGETPDQTVVLHLRVPRKWTKKHPGRLLWIPQVIPPSRILAVESLVRELKRGDNA